MALLIDSVESKKLDVRMVERNIARGVISSDVLGKAMEELPDDAENAEWVNVDSLMHDADETELNGHAPQHQH